MVLEKRQIGGTACLRDSSLLAPISFSFRHSDLNRETLSKVYNTKVWENSFSLNKIYINKISWIPCPLLHNCRPFLKQTDRNFGEWFFVFNIVSKSLLTGHTTIYSWAWRGVTAPLPVVPPSVLELGEVPVLRKVEYGHVDDIFESGASGRRYAVAFSVQVFTNLDIEFINRLEP